MKKRKIRRSAIIAKVALVCPRCGHKKSVIAIQTKHMIVCSWCGAGMRER